MNQITIDGPKKLLSQIPTIIKFNPSNQLIICGLKDAESKFAIHLTYPLPTQIQLSSAFFKDLNIKLVEEEIEAVVLVFYIEEAPENYRKISKILFENLSQKVHVKDLLWVKNNRWASFLCEDLNCCPQEGNPLEIEDSSTSSGKVDENFLNIKKSDSKVNLAARKALKVKSGIKDNSKLTKWQKTQYKQLSAKGAIASTNKNNWSRLLVGLSDIPVRDALLSHFIDIGFRKKNPSKFLIDLAKSWAKVGSVAEPQFQSPIFACISAFLWQAGEYKIAKIALNLSLAADNKFRLAHLLQNALDSGVPAHEFRDVFKNPTYPWT